MSVRSSAVRLLIHTGMVVGAIFAVTVLLAAMPGHHAPSSFERTHQRRVQRVDAVAEQVDRAAVPVGG